MTSSRLRLGHGAHRLEALADSLLRRFGADIVDHEIIVDRLWIRARGAARDCLAMVQTAPDSIPPLAAVQPASEIAATLTSGAMSHGALVASAHEAVAHGTNMVGGLSRLR